MTQRTLSGGLAVVALVAAFVLTGRERDARADAVGKTMSIASGSFQMLNVPIAQVVLLTSATVTQVSIQGTSGGKTYTCFVNVPTFAEAAEIRVQITSDKTKTVECIGNGASGATGGTVTVPLGPTSAAGPALRITSAP